MRTVKIIHTTPAAEANMMGCFILLAIASAIIVFCYTMVHKLWESEIPWDQLEISWYEPDQRQIDNDAFYGGGPNGSKTTTRTSYNIEVDVRNNSKYRLYSLDYSAELHVCETLEQKPENCPVVQTVNGQFSPDFAPGSHGLQKQQLNFGDASKFIGYGRLLIAWTSAKGVTS